jgi:hypothetical protein
MGMVDIGSDETKTVYTTLRNYVGHITDKVDIESVVRDMSIHVEGVSRPFSQT